MLTSIKLHLIHILTIILSLRQNRKISAYCNLYVKLVESNVCHNYDNKFGLRAHEISHNLCYACTYSQYDNIPLAVRSTVTGLIGHSTLQITDMIRERCLLFVVQSAPLHKALVVK